MDTLFAQVSQWVPTAASTILGKCTKRREGKKWSSLHKSPPRKLWKDFFNCKHKFFVIHRLRKTEKVPFEKLKLDTCYLNVPRCWKVRWCKSAESPKVRASLSKHVEFPHSNKLQHAPFRLASPQKSQSLLEKKKQQQSIHSIPRSDNFLLDFSVDG